MRAPWNKLSYNNRGASGTSSTHKYRYATTRHAVLDSTSIPYMMSLPFPLQGLPSALPVLRSIVSSLPRPTLAWRLGLMSAALPQVSAALLSLQTRTMIVASSQDLLLPSQAEAMRLASRMPKAFAKVWQKQLVGPARIDAVFTKCTETVLFGF